MIDQGLTAQDQAFLQAQAVEKKAVVTWEQHVAANTPAKHTPAGESPCVHDWRNRIMEETPEFTSGCVLWCVKCGTVKP